MDCVTPPDSGGSRVCAPPRRVRAIVPFAGRLRQGTWPHAWDFPLGVILASGVRTMTSVRCVPGSRPIEGASTAIRHRDAGRQCGCWDVRPSIGGGVTPG